MSGRKQIDHMLDIESRLLPCPFCGERLVVHGDHHGEWIAHRNVVGPCTACPVQIFDEADARAWNQRTTPKEPA